MDVAVSELPLFPGELSDELSRYQTLSISVPVSCQQETSAKSWSFCWIQIRHCHRDMRVNPLMSTPFPVVVVEG